MAIRQAWCLLVCLGVAVLATAGDDARPYELTYRARFVPDEDCVEASLTVRQPRARLTLVDLNAPQSRFSDFEGDGQVTRDDDRLIWEVPAQGGTLRYRVEVDHQRSGAYDARMTEDWAVARLDDLFPAARTRGKVGARAEATLYLDGPDDWSFETRYGPVDEDGVTIDTRGRRFDRPLGWMAAGELGIRRTRIGDRRIAIAGPTDEGFRRMDLLTFLRWTLPELIRVAPSLPERVLIVSGSDGMWRGGLSGPGSLYVHPDRPLVSENSTSTMLHELMHVATESPPADDDDWIVEGIAEYYSLVILLRTGGISGRRFERSLESLREWATEDDGELADPSTGADTARAALLFRDLDVELRSADARLDDVTAQLLAGGVNRTRLRALVEEALGGPSKVLSTATMP